MELRTPSDFTNTKLYSAITKNSVNDVKKILSNKKDSKIWRFLSSKGETYLHCAIQNKCNLEIIKALIPKVRLGQKNENTYTALELAVQSKDQNAFLISKFHQEFILDCIRDGNYPVIKELAIDGWRHWPVKGVPEIEKFAEAPGYLTPSGGEVNIHKNMPAMISKKHVKKLAPLAMKTKTIQTQRDILGMNLLHKAVIYKEFEFAVNLLECEEMVKVQDNMGRTPLHYAGAYGADNDVWQQCQDSCKDMLDIVDKLGMTALDYANGKAKIDLHKVRHLCSGMAKYVVQLQLLKALVLSKDYYGSEFNNFEDSPEEAKTVMFNCEGEPLLDSSGRNFLHRYVILDEKRNFEYADFLKLDSENKLFKGRDLWGRTPLHYAHMFDEDAVEELTKKRLTLTLDVIKEVKAMKDHEGKTADDCNMNKTEAKKLRKNLMKTITLLAALPQIIQCQYTVANLLFVTKPQKKEKEKVMISDSEDSDNEDGDESDNEDGDESDEESEYKWKDIQEVLNDVLDESENEEEDKLLFNMQMPTGIPLGYYLFLKGQEMLDDMSWHRRKHTDNMGRSPYHYLSYIPEASDMRENLLDFDHENPDDFLDFADSSSSDEGSSDEDEINRLEDLSPAKMTDLKGKTPIDYASVTDQFGSKEAIFQDLKKCIQDFFPATLISDNTKNTDTKNVAKRLVTTPKPGTHTTKAKLSAEHRKYTNPDMRMENTQPFDTEYLKKALGETLTGGLAVISLFHPADPIEFLAHYLYKYAENEKYQKQKRKEEQELQLEIDQAEIDRQHQDHMKEEMQHIKENQFKQEKSVTFHNGEVTILEENED